MTKKKTVDAVYRELCAKDEVLMDGRCTKVIIRPKDKKIVYEEKKACEVNPAHDDPITERAKQKLFRDLYRDSKTEMRYVETAVTAEEKEGE